MSKHIH